MPVVDVSALVRPRVRTKILLLAAAAALWSAPVALAQPAATELMPGVSYTREAERIRGRQVVVHVVTTPKPGGLYRLVPVLSQGTITGVETVSGMQERLSKQATLVGINGDLFNWSVGYPSGIFMRDGVLHGRPNSGRSSLGIGADGILRLARVGFSGTFAVDDGKRQALRQLNRPLDGAAAGLFTPAWGESTPRAKNVYDVVVSGFPASVPNVDLAGRIVEVRRGGGTPIPADGIVLQAVGSTGRALAASAEPGLSLSARLGVSPWWQSVQDAIGGGPALVRNGRIALPTTEAFTSDQLLPRHPRTAVGQLADGRIVLVAVDGRQSFSAGVTLRDLARKLVSLGVVTGMAFDAGGSTTIAFDGRVLNSPSDGAERAVSTALMLAYYGVYVPEPANDVVSPNGDGVAEGQRLAYRLVRAAQVTARLIGPGGKVAWRDEREREPGTVAYEPDPELLRQGSWRWVVTAVDEAGAKSRAERSFTVDNTLGFLELSKRKLTVKKRGARLGVSFRLAGKARVSVTVETRAGRVVRTLLDGARRPPGAVELVWNGRDARGRTVASGRYVIRVVSASRIGLVDLTGSLRVRRAGVPG